MKSAVILGFVTQALAVAISPDRDGDRSPVATRTFQLPPFPGNSYPTKHADKREPQVLPPDGGSGDAPDPDKVQIVGLTYGGTGCPSSTVSHVLSDDRQVMTLIFDEYVAQIGPDVDMKNNRKNCQLNINLRYPGGFQYSIFSADYRGYAFLEKGVTGVQKSIYYFSGQTQQAETNTTWVGPLDKDYTLHDETDHTSTVWSPCGANGALNINSQLRLSTTDRKARGMLTNDSLDASFKQVVHVRWQKCEKK
ncbi:hypothetical protein FQN57_002352 [Myotisia sp. PD_48]|nr:hypothetical protein FQN57_002352 [Myotisia sp. PD_48]